jgi:hypothetical protein
MKTAVEWLYETLWKQNDYSLPSNILEQAKEMEKQQILDCCITTTQDVWISAMAAFGQEINFCDEDLEEQKQEAEQYYKETFNNNII